MDLQNIVNTMSQVALRKESVDRNVLQLTKGDISMVALRKESVDRNYALGVSVGKAAVALRKESVDRNDFYPCNKLPERESLSAWRAWIEIGTSGL